MPYLNYLLAIFFMQIGLGVMGPILPDIKSYFHINMATAGLVVSAFGLARLIFDLPGGVVAQKMHPALGTAIGTILVTIGHFCSALATEFTGLVTGRFIAGTGSAIANVVVLTHLSKESDYSNRGKILGIFQGFFLGGIGIGPAMGGLIGSRWGWRGAFYFCAITALLAWMAILGRLFSGGWREKDGVRAEKKAQALKARTSSGFNTGVTKKSLPATITVNFFTFIMLFALEGFNNTMIPLYGSLVLKLSPENLGVIISCGVVVRFLVSLGGGILSDKYGRLTVLIPCLFMAGIGILAIYLAFNFYSFLAAVLLFAIGRMGNNLPLTLLGDITPPGKLAWMTALNRFIADCGLAIGPWVLGSLADRWGFTAAGIFTITLTWGITLVLWLVFRWPWQERKGEVAS